ncbi:MAG: Cof-type HAD-IIB family hydrolase [Treponema sp.]|jgi:Cof subfamily protein (haloacid dehalogenase superfamily)|nr:Cof-type HAD-IIB family hydrolase [Treponema sp.]
MSRKINAKKIRGLAIDLDGTTLLPDTTLGDRTTKILKKLISDGMQIIISTGRAIQSSEIYLSAIGAEGPMVFYNGAIVCDVPSNKILSVSPVDIDVADFGIDLAREKNIHYQIYLDAGISSVTGNIDPLIKGDTLLIDRQSPEAETYKRHTGITPVITDLKKIISLPGLNGCIKSMIIADSSLHDEIRGKMLERFGNRINVIRSSQTFLEILNAGVSKGEGLKIAMKHRGLTPDEVIAFGDEENDLSMFSAAGFAVTLSNAREKIREAADLVIGSNADEGLAAYLEETFLS